ncbi:hydroxysqualene dehydroxylase HpnE [Actinopolymorpha sp. B17G11]|uniref:hydroxysqualene dehydroxylase HpnE n=1 Tax=Actinopolymorpha sp. B17G11 TaxID=3160861 RepID=UPI0032E4E811
MTAPEAGQDPEAGPAASLTGRSVAVVGGGLAGIAAACRLADRGAAVTLLEARPHLGGATYSFPRGDLTVDTGQHVFLRCYEAYRWLLDRLGVSADAPVQERFAIPVLHRGSADLPYRTAWLRRSRRGPAPLHLGAALARYAPLSLADRARLTPAVLALRTVDPDDPANDTLTFGSWLRIRGQSGHAVDRLWALITVAALNLHPDDASLGLAARVFRTGLLEDSRAADLGIPAVPLRQLHAEPAARLLAHLGVRLHTKAKVAAIVPARDRDTAGFLVRTHDGEVAVDSVVLAVPHQAAGTLVPEQAAPLRYRWTGLGSSPIVNVHLHYDRSVMPLAFAAALDSPVQWVFDRSQAAGVHCGQYLVVSLSAAHRHIATPAEELERQYADAMVALFPRARDARLIESFVTREPHATFRQGPGTAALRPAPRTELPGLVLAGAWTATGWPDTMEGAVRSGLRAADSIDRDPHALGRVLTEATVTERSEVMKKHSTMVMGPTKEVP